jgi:hypothetical protein
MTSLDTNFNENQAFNENTTFLNYYSVPNQIQSGQYRTIIESKLSNNEDKINYSSLESASQGKLNPNIPVYKNNEKITVDGKQVNVNQQFWQFRQPAGTIFTDYTSAGIANTLTDVSVRNLPLKSMGLNESTPSLVLSNTNNVRNNLQNYGKTYLLTTNMLNSEAWNNGIYNESRAISPYRPTNSKEAFEMKHSNLANKNDGDKFSRTEFPMRVDLPSHYLENHISSWQYINPICIKPNESNELDWIAKMKYGTFNLDSLLYIGMSCLTPEFSVIPPGYDKPVDVFSDELNYPPLTNIDYFNSGPLYYKKSGKSDGLYCSANSNYIAVPINHKYPKLDTSINFSPGNNSVSLGMIMSNQLKKFINQELYYFNKIQILRALTKQFLNDKLKLKKLEDKYPEIKTDYLDDPYILFNEEEKYTYIYNEQKFLHEKHNLNPQTAKFILNLNIFKLGGLSNYQNINGKVILDNEIYEITSDEGIFLLLPSMLSEDLFDIKKDSEGKCGGNNLQQTKTSCCFQGPAGAHNSNHTYYPTFNNKDPILTNMINTNCGPNPYNAPSTF